MNIEETHKEAKNELNTLGRVSHRLAMTEGPQLEKVLSLLLPRLLKRIGDNHAKTINLTKDLTKSETAKATKILFDQIHSKLIEMISHILKRVRADNSCSLPMKAILEILFDFEKNEALVSQGKDIDPFSLNLSLTFLTIGIPRSSVETLESIFPALLACLGAHSDVSSLSSASKKSQGFQISHLVLRCIEGIVVGKRNIKKRASMEVKSSSDLSTSSNTSTKNSSSTEITNESKHNLDLAREIIQRDVTGNVLYELLLDVLLYQNVDGNMPPPGLSQFSKERLLSGSSLTAKNWIQENSTGNRLKDLKISILDAIAPTRFDIFDVCGNRKRNGIKDRMNTSKMIALMIVSSGDQNIDVSDRASLYLKAHMDSFRSSSRRDKSNDGANTNRMTVDLMGEPIVLMSSLLSLVVGCVIADDVIAKKQSSNIITKLGQDTNGMDCQNVMLLKRRMVSVNNATSIMAFITSKVFGDCPSIFAPLSNHSTFESSRDYYDLCSERALLIGTLCHSCVKKYASSGNALSSLSISGNTGNPSISALKLVNALCIRLSSLYDVMMSNAIPHEKLHSLLSMFYGNAFRIVSIAASLHSGDISSKIGLEARDASYGIISMICRSEAASSEHSFVFNCGENSISNDTKWKTASALILFGCIRNESEHLLPRAIACLDSLLASYERFAKEALSSSNLSTDYNPWAMDIDKNDKSQTYLESLSIPLKSLLWNNVKPTFPKASRTAAVQWACKLLMPIDALSACHILCYLAGDSDVTVSATAIAALGLDKQMGEDFKLLPDENENTNIPSFNDFACEVLTDNPNSSPWRPRFLDFSPTGQSATIRFALTSLLTDFGDIDDAITTFIHCLCTILERAKLKATPSHLQTLEECSICLSTLLATSSFARRVVVQNGIIRSQQIAEMALNAPSSKARRFFSKSILHLFEDKDIWCDDDNHFQISSWLGKTNIYSNIKSCGEILKEMSSPCFTSARIHGAAFFGGSCIHALHKILETEKTNESLLKTIESASPLICWLGKGCLHSDEVIGNACAGALHLAFLPSTDDATILQNGKDVCKALSFLTKALKRFGNGDHTDEHRAVLLTKAAGSLLSSTTLHDEDVCSNEITICRNDCVDTLVSLLGSSANKKEPLLSIFIGEALGEFADAYSPVGSSWTLPKDSPPDEYSEKYANELPPHEQVLYKVYNVMSASNPQKRTAVAPVLFAIVGRASKKINQNNTSNHRHFIQTICKNLEKIQCSFLKLLSDPKSKQLSRESCQLGLAACFSLSKYSSKELSDNLFAQLLRAFGESSNHGGSALMETRSQENSVDVGGVDGMSEAALGAFKEMAKTALMINRQDVLYSLLVISVSHPFWETSNYTPDNLLGHENSLGGNLQKVKIALQPHMETLIPRLLKACNDPNKETKDKMCSLWVGLTAGGVQARRLIDLHLISIIDTLMKDAYSKLWRSRAASCLALSEVIVGRSWDDLGGGTQRIQFDEVEFSENCGGTRLLKLFQLTIRALDDVRIAVREAGDSLGRSLKSLTNSLCSPSVENNGDNPYGFINSMQEDLKAKSSVLVASTLIPWILNVGLNQNCAEALGFSISCLLNIIDVSKPKTLEPVLPELIGTLITSMSSLEPSVLNYLQERTAGQNASGDGYNRLESMRLRMAQSSPLATALSKCMDILKHVDVEIQKRVVSELDKALRCGAGFTTRGAAADAVSTMCSVTPKAFQFNGNSTSNPVVRLLRALYFASERERGTGAKGKMSHALGNIAKLAPPSAVRSLASKLYDRYFKASGGTNDDPSTRKAAAAALRAIAVRASNQFTDGGSKDIWIRKILPLAYIGKFDEDVSSLFQEVYDEGSQVISIGKKSAFSRRTEDVILPFLCQTLKHSLEDVSWKRRRIACLAITELCKSNTLSPPPRPTDFTSEQTSIFVERCKQRATASCDVLNICVNAIVSTRVWKGKEDLLSATSRLTSNWITFKETSNVSPVAFDADRTDLLVGDSWFSNDHACGSSPNDQDESKLVTCMGTSDDSDKEKGIDFSDMDEILDGDNYNHSEPFIPEGEALARPVSIYGLCMLLLVEGLPKTSSGLASEFLIYRTSALDNLSKILAVMNTERFPVLALLHQAIAPRLFEVMKCANEENAIPPVLVSKCFSCFGFTLFDNIGNNTSDSNEVNLLSLSKVLRLNCDLFHQSAWTIREASALCSASLVRNASVRVLSNIEVSEELMTTSSLTLKDKKFWRVRLAGLSIIEAFSERSTMDDNLLFEAILPMKERFIEVARACVDDKQSEVAAKASRIIALLTSW